MSNYSVLKVFHPIGDFHDLDRKYMNKLYETKIAPKEPKLKGSTAQTFSTYLSNDIVPSYAKKHKLTMDTPNYDVTFERQKDGTLLFCPSEIGEKVSLMNVRTEFVKVGRNCVPFSWRIACVTENVDVENLEKDPNTQPMMCAFISMSLKNALNNIQNYLDLVHKLPVSKHLISWIEFAKGILEDNEFGEWLALHYHLSKEPEKCKILIDWGEVGLSLDEKSMLEVTDNKKYLKYIEALKRAKTKEESLDFLKSGEKCHYSDSLLKRIENRTVF